MTNSKYPKYTVNELEALIQEKLENNEAAQAAAKDNLYDLLFAGMDIPLLNLMCIQVKWSLAGHEPDVFINAIRNYADFVSSLITLWQRVFRNITACAQYVNEGMHQACAAYRLGNSKQFEHICSDMQGRLLQFTRNYCGEQEAAQKQKSDLAAFIAGELRTAVSDKSRWSEVDLEACLSNDKFLDGTEAAVYNGGTVLALTADNISRSIEIIGSVDVSQSIDEIMFSISGQAAIWDIVLKIAKELETRLGDFHNEPPPLRSIYYGGNKMKEMMTETDETLQLKTVIDATQAVIRQKQSPPDYKIAQLMLRLMNGDTKVMKELPTLSQPLRQTAGESLTVAEGLMGETSESSVENSKGLLGLTKENIVDIKTYVKKSLHLKTTESEVSQILGYTGNDPISIEYPEFSPAKFAAFYRPFHEHAVLWDGIETQIISQGNAIQVYGTTFVSHSKFVLTQIEHMNLFEAEVGEASLTDPQDKKIQQALSRILARWQEETGKYQADTVALLNRLTGFQNTLVNTLQPSANMMFDLLNRIDIAAETKRLKQEMDTLQTQINAKQREYDKNCGLACTGAAGLIGGPLVIITWAVTGGIYGAKAEEARKERNRLQSEFNQKQVLYNSMNQVAGNVHLATDGIADLSIAVTNAITGLKTLNAVWNLLTKYIASAKESLDEIDCKSKLIDFMFGLESAQDSWSEVPSIAAGLLELFRQAEKSVELQDTFVNSSQLKEAESNKLSYQFDPVMWDDQFAALGRIRINPSSAYMPALQQKAYELKGDAAEIYDAVKQTLPGIVFVDGSLAQKVSAPKKLEAYEKLLFDNPSDAEAAEYYNALIGRFTAKAEAFDHKLAEVGNGILNNARILQKNTRTDLTATGFYAQLNQECKRFDGVLQLHTKMMVENFIRPMLALTEEMKSIDAEIEKKLDPENIIKGFKEFLPSETEVSEMLSKGAESAEIKELDAIKLVYSSVLKGLDVLAGTIKLCQQIDEQARLADELSELQQQYEKVQEDNQKMLDNQAELNGLLGLHRILEFFAEAGCAEAGGIQKMLTKLTGYVHRIPADYKAYHAEITALIQAVQERNSGSGSGVNRLGTDGNNAAALPGHSTQSLSPEKEMITIIPEASRFLLSQKTSVSQSVGEQKITYTKGYGQLSKAGTTVQKGVTGKIKIDLTIESLSEQFYKDTTNEITNTVSRNVAEELKESSMKKDYASWWFAFLAGGSNGEHSSDYYKNQQTNSVTIADTKYFNAASEKMSSYKQSFKVSGEFEIVGQSYIETTVYLFIETLTVQTGDGTTLVIPTQNTAVADEEGNTGAATTGGKINIMPLK